MGAKRGIAGVSCAVFLLACLLVAPPAGAEAGDPKAKALFEEKCSACHALSRPLGKTKDRDGWEKTVTRMQKANGCPITDAEAKEIVDYLAAVRGPGGK